MSEFIGKWGEWIGLENVDLIDDTKSVWLLNVGKTTSGQTSQQTLALRRFPDHLETGISWSTFISPDISVMVTTRFGNDQAITAPWDLSVERTVTLYPATKQIDFIQKLLQVDSLVARLTTAEGWNITVFFDVSCLSDALDDLKKREVIFF